MPNGSHLKKGKLQEKDYNAILEAESELNAIRKEIDNVWATHPNKEKATNILYEIWMPKLEKATAKAQKVSDNWNACVITGANMGR